MQSAPTTRQKPESKNLFFIKLENLLFAFFAQLYHEILIIEKMYSKREVSCCTRRNLIRGRKKTRIISLLHFAMEIKHFQGKFIEVFNIVVRKIFRPPCGCCLFNLFGKKTVYFIFNFFCFKRRLYSLGKKS